MIKKRKAKIAYYPEVDIFVARPLIREYDKSVQIEDFILDLDKKGVIVGIEILDVSKVFRVPKVTLNKIISGEKAQR